MSNPAIQVTGLSKAFRVSQRDPGFLGALRGLVQRRTKVIQALSGVTFSLDAGEIIGYIGPNGAGKSTTVKICSGIMYPDSGECQVLGHVPWQERIALASKIGVVFGQRTQLWWDLPTIESFQLLAEIYRLPRKDYQSSFDELTEIFGLQPLLDTPVRQLSLGQRMRCDIAAALLHRPQLLFLDEPTIGLDAAAKLTMRDHIRQLNTVRKVSIVLTTHDMADIEALCRRVIVLHHGGVLFDGMLADLRAHLRGSRLLTVDFVEACRLPAIPQTICFEQTERRVVLSFDPACASATEIITEIGRHGTIADLFIENPPIEYLIADLYREGL